MNYKCTLFLFWFSSLVSFASAEPAFYAGLVGGLNLPQKIDSTETTSLGYEFDINGGIQFGAFEGGICVGFEYTPEGRLTLSRSDVKFGAELSALLNKNFFGFFPEFLEIRPQFSYILDIYTSEFYRSKTLKDRDFADSKSGVASLLEVGLFFDLVNKFYVKDCNLVPFVGYGENIQFDEAGLVHSGIILVGVRLRFAETKSKNKLQEDGGVLTVNAEYGQKYFTPDGDGVDDLAVFNITSDADEFGGARSWEFNVYDPGKKLFYSESGKGKVQKNYSWNGKSLDGEVVMGGCSYQYVWTIVSKNGSKGLVPGVLETGVMVVEKEGVLSIMLPSISFAPNSASFDGLDSDKIKHNKELLNEVAKILLNYKDYFIEIEGHAHNVSGTDLENKKELIPLSLERAKTVMKELASLGIESKRMTARGLGGTKPLAQFKTEIWKNRRVEIKLIK